MTLQPQSLGLYAGVAFLWYAVNYLPASILPATPRHTVRLAQLPTILWRSGGRGAFWIVFRACLAGLGAVALAGWHQALGLGLLVGLTSIVLPLLRRHLVPENRLAEFELSANLLLAGALFAWMSHYGLQLRGDLLPLIVRWSRLPGYVLSASILVYLSRGGTFIVRGVLARGGTMPPDPNPSSSRVVDQLSPTERAQLNHGRLIGIAERLILALLVANGQYASLAFFFAAKGLIRSKDLELRAWADYLLLGSLTSFLIALVAGMMIGHIMSWR